VPLRAIADDHVAARRGFVKPVQLGAGEVLQGVFPGSRIKGVAIGQEGFATQFFDQIGNGFRVIGAKIRKVAQFAKMHLDGNELPIKIDVLIPAAIIKRRSLLVKESPGRERKSVK
jgi:hypothetical protein